MESAVDRDAICRLRYDAYLREGAIGPDFSKRLADRFDDLENTWTFAVHIDGMLASSFRIHVAQPGRSDTPVMKVFPDFLKSEIEADRTIIDPTRFVADWTLARCYPELPYVTVLTLTKPLSLMMLHFPSARDEIVRRHPFFRSTLFERRMLFERTEQAAQRTAA